MGVELLLSIFLMVVGVSLAGAATHFYQGLFKEPAMLRFDGAHVMGMFGHLLMSFICGPYIMLKMGWNKENDGKASLFNILLGSGVAFGWAFFTGLLFVGIYIAVTGG